MTVTEKVLEAMRVFEEHREPLSLSILAMDVEAPENEVIASLGELREAGLLVFTGRSGSVPDLRVIEGGL